MCDKRTMAHYQQALRLALVARLSVRTYYQFRELSFQLIHKLTTPKMFQ